MAPMTIEELKRVDLVELLSRVWGLSFHRQGASFVTLSPFAPESKPSFYAACEPDGHWVYCDHCDGSSGSVIDLMLRKFQTADVGRACAEARSLVALAGLSPAPAAPAASPAREDVDWEWLHQRLRRNDPSPCRGYLLGRGLDSALVDRLIAQGVVVLNRMDGSDYCAFAVRDRQGRLQSLFNRRIDGPSEREKFLLGRQHPFCPDWEQLQTAGRVYLCEALIDALSVLTVCPEACVLALPGAHFDLSKLELPAAARLVDAFDEDSAGRAAAARLLERFPSHPVERFDLLGAHDVNEYLQRRDWMSDQVRGTGKLTAEERLAIAFSDKPSRELARQYGVHHSRVCDIRNEAAAIVRSAWADRHPGRKPQPAPPGELLRKEQELKTMKQQFELETMRREWLQLQVQFHDQRDAEVARDERQRKRQKKARTSST